MCRLQQEAAEKVKIPSEVLKQGQSFFTSISKHHFAAEVANNFDMNTETLYGEYSIHILNQIVVQIPENNEVSLICEHLLNDMCGQICMFSS
ncbi:unnamed protein product [Rotaria magnacalcarata]|nr:unnamed protein product [Rotaria magnacalcarata]CAF2043068.1 unnamed protein product [Rotaria magnacalcarata]